MRKVVRVATDGYGRRLSVTEYPNATIRQLDDNLHFVSTRFELRDQKDNVVAIMQGGNSFFTGDNWWADGFVPTSEDELMFWREHWSLHQG